jgi:uncharacterized protein (DUF983 family)
MAGVNRNDHPVIIVIQQTALILVATGLLLGTDLPDWSWPIWPLLALWEALVVYSIIRLRRSRSKR